MLPASVWMKCLRETRKAVRFSSVISAAASLKFELLIVTGGKTTAGEPLGSEHWQALPERVAGSPEIDFVRRQ